jgi:hypothetical protein
VTFLDPDGRRVVFAPWVFGEEEEPGTGSPSPGVALSVG